MPYELAATERCVRRDLDLSADAVAEAPLAQRERHALLEAFYARREQSSVGQETIEGLQANIVAYSLHAGRWLKGATDRRRRQSRLSAVPVVGLAVFTPGPCARSNRRARASASDSMDEVCSCEQ